MNAINTNDANIQNEDREQTLSEPGKKGEHLKELSIGKARKSITAQELSERLQEALPEGSVNRAGKSVIQRTFAEERKQALQVLEHESDPEKRAMAISQVYGIDRAADLVTRPFESRLNNPARRYSCSWYQETIADLRDLLQKEREQGRTETIVSLLEKSEELPSHVCAALLSLKEERKSFHSGSTFDAIEVVSYLQRIEEKRQAEADSHEKRGRIHDIHIERTLVLEWFAETREEAWAKLRDPLVSPAEKAMAASIIHMTEALANEFDRAKYPPEHERLYLDRSDSSYELRKYLEANGGVALQGFKEVPALLTEKDASLLDRLEVLRVSSPLDYSDLVGSLSPYLSRAEKPEIQAIVPMKAVVEAYLFPLRIAAVDALKGDLPHKQRAVLIDALWSIDTVASHYGSHNRGADSAESYIRKELREGRCDTLRCLLDKGASATFVAAQLEEISKEQSGFSRSGLEERRKNLQNIIEALPAAEAIQASRDAVESLCLQVSDDIQSLRSEDEYKKAYAEDAGLDESLSRLVDTLTDLEIQRYAEGRTLNTHELFRLSKSLQEFYTGCGSDRYSTTRTVDPVPVQEPEKLQTLLNELVGSLQAIPEGAKTLQIYQVYRGSTDAEVIGDRLRAVVQKTGIAVDDQAAIKNRYIDKVYRFAGSIADVFRALGSR